LKKYDFIIAGAGCAGLSFAMHLVNATALSSKKILLVDKSPKESNDRTWCFWETHPGIFEEIVFRQWQQVYFNYDNNSRLLDLHPYQYKMIRGIDFYKFAYDKLSTFENVDFHYGEIQSSESNNKEAWVNVNGERFVGEYLFNSLLPPLSSDQNYHYLKQHFKGCLIRANQPMFHPKYATLMDFRVSQQHGTTFIYILPFSETDALVEYTVFSTDLLPEYSYKEGIQKYLSEYYSGISYEIVQEEFGIIPMTNYRFPACKGREIFIGTAGGQTKPSTGYTFSFIQKHSKAITTSLEQTGRPYLKKHFASARFHWYDSTLLHILDNHLLGGEAIFTRLFLRNSPSAVLSFLENASSVKQEIRLTASLQKRVFIRAALNELFR
jgi:lycopene beta-cyclase